MAAATAMLAGFAFLTPEASAQESRESAVNQDGWTGTVRLFLGGKQLNETEWAPVEDQGEWAIITNFGPRDWAVQVAFDMRFAASETEDFLGADVTSFSYEINFGIRTVFDTGSIVKPYIGAGIALGGAAFEIDSEEESDDGIGVWFDAGVDFMIVGPLCLGIELAISTIPIEISDIDTDAGGVKLGLTLGFSW